MTKKKIELIKFDHIPGNEDCYSISGRDIRLIFETLNILALAHNASVEEETLEKEVKFCPIHSNPHAHYCRYKLWEDCKCICTCFVSPKDTAEGWQTEFKKKFWVSRIGGDHVGAEHDAVKWIENLLKTHLGD